MKLTTTDVLPIAGATGFKDDMVEKVLHLIGLLGALNAHPYLKGRWILKGGTALNLFVLDFPRLSLDIDLNYVGAEGRDDMLADRPAIEKALHAVVSREGFGVARMPQEHAGGKWRLTYSSVLGGSGTLEVDFNYMFRVPLWPINLRDSYPLGAWRAVGIPVLDIHELAAGKLAALLSRKQARDLFDAHSLLRSGLLERESLRLAFVVYGAMNRKDWRTVSVNDVDFDPVDLERNLSPTLNRREQGAHDSANRYGTHMVNECREALSAVLPLSEAEIALLDTLLDEGRIEPSLLTDDVSLQDRIRRQPLLEWKAQNVLQHRAES